LTAGLKKSMLWPFSGRAGKTDLTCGCGCACTENNGGSDVYARAITCRQA